MIDLMKALRDYRRDSGKTQVEMARECGVALMTYQLWERGGMRPSEKNMKKVMRIIGGSRDDRLDQGQHPDI